MRRACALLAALACALPLAACASSEAVLPDGVTVSAYQTRLDVAARVLEMSVTNDSPEPLTITGVSFESEQFAQSAEWTKRDSTVVPAGRTIDLPVELGEPACAVENPRHHATLEFILPDGRSGTATVDIVDRLDRLPALRAEDCLSLAVAEIATISVQYPPRDETVDGRLVALLDIRIEPTGSAGGVTLDSARGTTLLSVADPQSGAPLNELPLGVPIDSSSEATAVTISVVPNRCDPHAVAEDKRGTVIPIQVTLDDATTGTLYLPSPEHVKLAIYDYVADYCDFPE